MMDDDRRLRAILSWLYEPGPDLHDLVAAHGVATAAHRLTAAHPPLPVRHELRHLPEPRLLQTADTAVDDTHRQGIRVIVPGDRDWPNGLRHTLHPPICLWARGPQPPPSYQMSVTIAGARAATSYGIHVATEMAAAVAGHGWTVVAAPAHGIGGIALRTALTTGQPPTAVVAHGVDQIHPAAHQTLYDRLADHGLILSAWPPGAKPTRERILANQSWLAVLTAATVLVEAAPRSTDRQLVEAAFRAGRFGMAVPGPVTSLLSGGCHDLLRTNRFIRPVTCGADIIADLTAS